MGIQLDPLIATLIAVSLLVLAKITFIKVRSDYTKLNGLSKPVAFFQTGYFCIYALSSYLFLDSRFFIINLQEIYLLFKILLMVVGISIVMFSMPILGRRSFGHSIGNLHSTGLYRYSRNPQLVGSFIFIIGYCFLWPSWNGFLWGLLWLPISYMMIKAEEEHLLNVFGVEYENYRKKTACIFGFPKK